MNVTKKESGNTDSLINFIRYLKKQGIAESEYQKKISWYLEDKARKNKVPVQGYFELTPLCNLECKMCYIHLNSIKFDSRNLLDVETWKMIISEAYRAGMRNATLTGGECLTYPDFDELYLFLKQLGVRIQVLSNGVLIDQNRISFFVNNPPDSIQVSLYGSNNNVYENVTGYPMFYQVFENIKKIRDAGLKLRIAITPNRFMVNDMRPLLELVHSLNVPYEINCQLFHPRDVTERNIEDITLDQYIELYRIRAELFHSKLTPTNPTELPDINRDTTNKKGLLCGAGSSSFAINYEGKMMPCVSLDNISVSVLNKSFSEAWNLINQAASDYPIPGECDKCVYFPVCIHCQAQHYNAPLGHCDPYICERTRKLAEEGFFHYEPR